MKIHKTLQLCSSFIIQILHLESLWESTQLYLLPLIGLYLLFFFIAFTSYLLIFAHKNLSRVYYHYTKIPNFLIKWISASSYASCELLSCKDVNEIPTTNICIGYRLEICKKNPAVSLNIRIRIYMLQFCFAEELPSFSGLKIKKNTDQLILLASDSY